MTSPVARLIFAVGVALAASATVSAEDAAPVGRDLVVEASGQTIRLRVVVLVDGKSTEQRREAVVKAVAAHADADQDGVISQAEWQKAFNSLGVEPWGHGDPNGDTPEFLSQYLADRLGALMEIVVQPRPLVDRLELFTALDADENGFITASEFGDSERLFARYDADGDGTLNQPELAPTEPLQPMPVRSGTDFPPGRFPFHWEDPHGEADAVVEIKLIGRAFGRPKVVVKVLRDESSELRGKADDAATVDPQPSTLNPQLSIASETRKASIEVANVALDLDATPARITSEDVKRFYMLQLLQRDADKNGYLDESEFLGLGLPGLDFRAADANGDGMLFRDELRAELDARIARETSRVRVEATYERQPLFTKLDADGDARLSRRELRGSQQALSSIDADGDGRIGLAEFGGRYRLSFSVPNLLDGANPRMVAQIEAMPRGPSPRAAEGPAWFAAMDRNADGDLARREFLGTAATFAKIDADGDGLIAPEEANAIEETATTDE
ncbi:MAG: hypothetical protein WBC44_13965 [Planctomycetaceae bacterium]